MSLPPEVAARVRELAEAGQAESVSAFVTDAVTEKVNRQRRAREWLDRKLAAAERADPQAFATARAWTDRVFESGPGGHAA